MKTAHVEHGVNWMSLACDHCRKVAKKGNAVWFAVDGDMTVVCRDCLNLFCALLADEDPQK